MKEIRWIDLFLLLICFILFVPVHELGHYFVFKHLQPYSGAYFSVEREGDSILSPITFWTNVPDIQLKNFPRVAFAGFWSQTVFVLVMSLIAIALNYRWVAVIFIIGLILLFLQAAPFRANVPYDFEIIYDMCGGEE